MKYANQGKEEIDNHLDDKGMQLFLVLRPETYFSYDLLW